MLCNLKKQEPEVVCCTQKGKVKWKRKNSLSSEETEQGCNQLQLQGILKQPKVLLAPFCPLRSLASLCGLCMASRNSMRRTWPSLAVDEVLRPSILIRLDKFVSIGMRWHSVTCHSMNGTGSKRLRKICSRSTWIDPTRS